MRRVRSSLLFLAAALAVAAPGRLAAQRAGFGPEVLYDFDMNAGLGVQARLAVDVAGYPFILNPSVDYYFVDDEGSVDLSLLQLNADALWQLGRSADVNLAAPYIGAGLGLAHSSVDAPVTGSVSHDDLVLNLIAGVNFLTRTSFRPFAQAAVVLGNGGSRFQLKGGIIFGKR